MFSALGGRKFVFILLMSLFASAFVFFGKMSVEAWTAFILAVGAVYITVNQAGK